MRAPPSERGSPAPRSAMRTFAICMSGGFRGLVGVACRGVATLGTAQAGDGVGPLGFEPVLAAALGGRVGDDGLGRDPRVVHRILMGEVAVAFRQLRDREELRSLRGE